MLNIANHQENATQNHGKISLHAGQNGYHQKEHKLQMLVRMWRKGNPCTLLVGMLISAATLKNSMEISQKTKNRAGK